MPGEPFEVAALLSRSLVLGVLCFGSGSPQGLFDGRTRRRAAEGAFRPHQKVLIDFDRRPLRHAYNISIGISPKPRFETPARPGSRNQVPRRILLVNRALAQRLRTAVCTRAGRRDTTTGVEDIQEALGTAARARPSRVNRALANLTFGHQVAVGMSTAMSLCRCARPLSRVANCPLRLRAS
jgi:hypothetical protein